MKCNIKDSLSGWIAATRHFAFDNVPWYLNGLKNVYGPSYFTSPGSSPMFYVSWLDFVPCHLMLPFSLQLVSLFPLTNAITLRLTTKNVTL